MSVTAAVVNLGLPAIIATFCLLALGIALLGSRLARLADTIADRTGWGEAIVGCVLLGAGTSIPGIVTSVTTAAGGYPALSVSNAVGGIAVQTVFLALADITYRKANLEHAATSAVSMTQAIFLIILLILPLVAWSAPQVQFFAVHPVTPALFIVYLLGLRSAGQQRREPMWEPKKTEDTDPDVATDDDDSRTTFRLMLAFSMLTAIVGTLGWGVGASGVALTRSAGLSESLVGTLLTAVATSLPELVTTLAAIRLGAPQLAIGGIIGGNMFDALFVAASDIAYRDGSIYHVIGEREIFWTVLSLLMLAVLLAGMLNRQRQGPAGIGWESILLLVLYFAGVALQIAQG